MIEHLKRFGLARIARWNDLLLPLIIKEKEEIEKHFPERMDIKKIAEIEIYGKIIENEEYVILPGLFTQKNSPRDMFEKIINARLRSLKKVLYVPFFGDPSLFPILVYLGVDVVDVNYSQIFECHNEFYQNSQDCVNEFTRMENIVREGIKNGRIREIVESIPNPLSKTLLRLSDQRYDIFEKFYPVQGDFLNASHFESLSRPDIKRWMERIEKRYRKPNYAKNVLFLPCSATKPYSRSRSHAFFNSLIEKSNANVHKVVLTSPLGIVPMELEYTYPAQNYDIPVTGHWFEEEKAMLIDLLETYLKNNPYEKIFAYLPDDLDFLENTLEKHGAKYIIGNLRSMENQEKMISYLKETKKNVYFKEKIADDIVSVGRFQFGYEFPMENVRIRKIYDDIVVEKDGEQYLYFSSKNGFLKIYRKSAELLYEKNLYTVEIENFIPKGSVFSVGILNASRDIREGDHVVVYNESGIVGTGLSKMSYLDLLSQDHGEAISMEKIFQK